MRYIYCDVRDEYISGAGVSVGAAGSKRDVALRLSFGVNWQSLNKYVTFRDALGENPERVMLLGSMLVPGTENTYDVPIPASAKTKQGRMMVTITGYSVVDGNEGDSATNTATAYFRVLPSDYALLDDGSIDATLAMQLQAEIEAMRKDTTFKDMVEVVSSDATDERTTEILPGSMTLKHSDDYFIHLYFDEDGSIYFSTSVYMPSAGVTQEIYTSLSHPKMDLINPIDALEDEDKSNVRTNIGLDKVDNTADKDKPVSDAVREALDGKADKENPVLSGKITLDGAEIYRDMVEDEYGNATGNIILYRPETGVTPESALKIGYDLLFSKGGKNYEIYHAGNLKDITAEGTVLSDENKHAALTNLGITAEVNTEKVYVGGAEIYVETDDEGCIVIHRPMSEGFVPDSTVKIGFDYILFNGGELYHNGNLKNLAVRGNVLDDITEKAAFMANTGLDVVLGNIETALDNIIAMQNTLIGGDAE